MEPDSKNLISNRCNNFAINATRFQNILNTIQEALNFTYSYVDFSFVDSEEMQELNRTHRGKDAPTDVLSFPQWSWKEAVVAKHKDPAGLIEDPIVGNEALLLGDIVVCPALASQNAEYINQSLEREITFLALHGILHLCGHDHHEPVEEALMNSEQKRIMKILEEGPAWSGLFQEAE